MFVVAFEGLDKSGKETTSKLLLEALQNGGMKVAHMAFPRYDTPTGQQIRQVLDGEVEATVEELAELYELDRAAAQADIHKHEAEGVAVLIIDRYTMSNLYAVARGMDLHRLQIMQKAMNHYPANLHIFIDIPVEESLRRGQAYDKLDIFEVDVDLLQKARQTYLDYIQAHHAYFDGGTIAVINGLDTPDSVFIQACEAYVKAIEPQDDLVNKNSNSPTIQGGFTHDQA